MRFNEKIALAPNHAVSANRILWVYTEFWWYHGILVVQLQDSVGAFRAIKDQCPSIRGLSVENVLTDVLSTVCSWRCMMLFLITKIIGTYFEEDQMWLQDTHLCYFILNAVRPCMMVLLHGQTFSPKCTNRILQMHQQNPVVPPESGVHQQNLVCTYSVLTGIRLHSVPAKF